MLYFKEPLNKSGVAMPLFVTEPAPPDAGVAPDTTGLSAKVGESRGKASRAAMTPTYFAAVAFLVTRFIGMAS
ncbi:MAG: hypothetical protein A2X57_05100 [Nitrospirae bacterium GWD2_57_8]|nr:MAG: hypothetical protein A2X57_05100 [Nitrospirae bacterium GWD2_57_8]